MQLMQSPRAGIGSGQDCIPFGSGYVKREYVIAPSYSSEENPSPGKRSSTRAVSQSSRTRPFPKGENDERYEDFEPASHTPKQAKPLPQEW